LEDRALPSFVAPLSYDTGPGPVAVAVGDFNGDGIPDLVVANSARYGGVPSVGVLLGNGDGTFQAVRTFAAGASPVGVAVGDLNGDGSQDLVVTDQSGGTVSVLLGNEDGSFQPAVSYAVGAVQSVAIGDFNGDGIPDLAVADGNQAVRVLLGHGDGTFGPARTFAVGNNPQTIAVGDFNGDGLLDLAVACYGSDNVSVLLGNGDGSFQPARSFAAGHLPQGLAVGDFNGDGVQDLAVTDGGGSPFNGSVSVLLGNGDGSFQTARDYPVGASPNAVAVGDLSGDGVQDLVVADLGGTGDLGSVGVLRGHGDGTFQPARTLGAGARPASVAVADFTGDGVLDLAVANRDSNNLSVRLRKGRGVEGWAVGLRRLRLWHSLTLAGSVEQVSV
jgi:hypothetical protein